MRRPINNPIKVPYLKHMWNRTHKYKYGWMQVIVGDPGTGKSWAEMTLGEILDPKFDINKIAFSPSEFMDAIDDVKYNGEVICIEELGVILNARKWASMSNILTNEVLQTMRYKHIISFFTVPDISFIDSQARKLLNCFSETRRTGYEPANLWVYNVMHDRKRSRDPYFIHPRIMYNGAISALQYFVMKRKPSPQLLKEYKEKEMTYKDKINKRNRNALKQMEQQSEVDSRTVFDYVNDVNDNIEDFKNVRGTLDWHLIAMKLGIGEPKAKQIKKYVEKESVRA